MRIADRLSAADASNIAIDSPDQVNAFLIAGALAPGGFVSPSGDVDLDALRVHVTSRLRASPRLRQTVEHSRAGLVWQDCVPDLSWHVRQVEAVGDRAGFERLCAHLIVRPLPADRPLWEILVVPDVEAARPGIVLRLHHALADGVGAVHLALSLMDLEPGRASASAAAPADPADQGDPVPRLRGVRMFVSGLKRTAAMLSRRAAPSALIGPLSAERGVAFISAPLEPLAAAASSCGATVNDALLAAVAGAVRVALRTEGRPVPSRLPASVPVALPNRGTSGNAVGVMLVDLPIDELDARVRLRTLAPVTRAAKMDARRRGMMELMRTPWGARLFARFARHQRLVAAFVTNVPGPHSRLLLAGAPLTSVWPLTALQGNVRLGVSALSYAGVVHCAVHCESHGLSAAVLGEALSREFDAIIASGSRTGSA